MMSLERSSWILILDSSPLGLRVGLYDQQTGLLGSELGIMMRRRGRWTAKDPIGFNGGIQTFMDI